MQQEKSLLLEPRPYLLHNKIQHYAWGSRGKDAFIPQLLGIEADRDIPYAELWLGAHPSAPSWIDINGSSIGLDELISQYPDQMLGEFVTQRFAGKLPFLFKVLSAAEALSIQAHPNQKQAVTLHARDPQHYPDNNHKPEIAIALTSLTAFVGFKPFHDILKTLESYPELSNYIGTDIIEKLKNSVQDIHDRLRCMYSILMKKSMTHEKELAQAIGQLEQRLKSGSNRLKEEEQLFLDLKTKYGTDVGLLSLFLLNLIHLKEGEGIFISAGIPHAYVKGDIVECMANSDNVVRAGLTPKYKDIETVVEILTYEMGLVPILKPNSNEEIIYQTPAREFEVTCWDLTTGQEKNEQRRNSPVILLIIEGNMTIRWKDEIGTKQQEYHRGQSIFMPAMVNEYQLKATVDSKIFKVEVPSFGYELSSAI